MPNENHDNDTCNMLQEIKEVHEELNQEEKMPHMTTTEKLLRPAHDEVEG